jgi:hypothetical protein
MMKHVVEIRQQVLRVNSEAWVEDFENEVASQQPVQIFRNFVQVLDQFRSLSKISIAAWTPPLHSSKEL